MRITLSKTRQKRLIEPGVWGVIAHYACAHSNQQIQHCAFTWPCPCTAVAYTIVAVVVDQYSAVVVVAVTNRHSFSLHFHDEIDGRMFVRMVRSRRAPDAACRPYSLQRKKRLNGYRSSRNPLSLYKMRRHTRTLKNVHSPNLPAGTG